MTTKLYRYAQECTYGDNAKAALAKVSSGTPSTAETKAAYLLVFDNIDAKHPCITAVRNDYCMSSVLGKNQKDVQKVKTALTEFQVDNNKYIAADKADILNMCNSDISCATKLLKEWCYDATHSSVKHDLLCGADTDMTAIDQHVEQLVGAMFASQE